MNRYKTLGQYNYFNRKSAIYASNTALNQMHIFGNSDNEVLTTADNCTKIPAAALKKALQGVLTDMIFQLFPNKLQKTSGFTHETRVDCCLTPKHGWWIH